MAPSALEKAEKAKGEVQANLTLAVKIANTQLKEGERNQLSLRAVNSLITKLEAGLEALEKITTELTVIAGEDEEAVDTLASELLEKTQLANPLLDQLFDLRDTLQAASRGPAAPLPGQQNLLALQLKIRMAQKTLDTRLQLIADAAKKPEVLASPSVIQSMTQQLQDLSSYAQTELDTALGMMSDNALAGTDLKHFQDELSALIDTTTQEISTLTLRFTEAAATLKKPEVETTTTAETAAHSSLQEQVAREVANLKLDMESRESTSRRSGGDFCFAKVPVPDFKGDAREFTKWRSQVEDYLNEVARKSTQKSAVHMLDRLTPKTSDVSRCLTLTEAWSKLSSKFGSPVHIARLLLRDFSNCSLKKNTDEAKVIELRDILEKLESDMLTNGQAARCEDFTVLDHAESMIPGRFRDQYVRVKEDLVETAGSGFKALTSFLEDEATLVERHLPDRLLDNAPKSEASPRDQESKEIRELKATIARLEGQAARPDKPTWNKEISEQKAGKCPICDEYHYFKSTRGPSQGQDLASPCLHTCPKYKTMTLDQKVDTIITKKACAACTDWRHERPSCPSKADKPCRKDGCSANHHTSLHGTQNPKVMALRTRTNNVMKSPQQSDTPDENSEDSGLLAMLHYTFKDVNQGTVIFIDEGSQTSAISTKLARALYMQGKITLTTVTRAFEKIGQNEP